MVRFFFTFAKYFIVRLKQTETAKVKFLQYQTKKYEKGIIIGSSDVYCTFSFCKEKISHHHDGGKPININPSYRQSRAMP